MKREEGTKKYLNILWDYTGGRLRDVTKSRYFFPKPVPVEMDDGKKIDGYHGSSKVPFYPVIHNHLPELDFADMIRSPLMELGRQCMKFGVPIKDSKKYIDMLLLKLLPFLDYVYTERRSGRGNYVREGLRELRTVIELIKSEYGTRNGRPPSITAEVMESIMNDTPIETEEAEKYKEENADENKSHILQDIIDEAKRDGAVLDESLQTLEELLKNGTLDEEDSKELLREYQEQSRRLGIKIHRFVSKNFQSPLSFRGVVYHGTEMAYDNSGLILLSETPVDDGRGRLDFLLVRAKSQTRVDGTPSVITCEPFLVADLKTKSAFDFDVYGTESRTKDDENVVREFVLNHREMTDEEWSNVLATTPDEYETGQVDAYEQAVMADYKRFMKLDYDAQKNLAKAVLIVDSCQSWREISKSVLPLVMKAYQGCIDGTLSDGVLLIPSNEQRDLRVALRILSVIQPDTITEELDIPVPQKSFKYRVEDQKEFHLYLTVSGRGSPSESAATIAERWHGLEYIYSLAKSRHRDVYWFDLVGDYSDMTMRKKQFRMKYQNKSIQRFFRERVHMRDLSEHIRAFIYEGLSISLISTCIQSQLRESRDSLIVVSGWEHLRRSTPESHQSFLDEIVTSVFQALPRICTIVWFARPVPIAPQSITYSTRCVAPFYHGSVWQNIVDTILWNVALPPDRSGTQVSTNYHERCILIEKPEISLEWNIIEIDPLRGWHQDFQSGGRRLPEAYYRIGTGVVKHSSWSNDKQLECTLKLIPHLLPHHEYNPVPYSDFNLEIRDSSALHRASEEKRLRLIFNPTQVQTELEKDGRIKPLLPMADINRRRESREMQLAVPNQQTTTRPPSEYFLTRHEMDFKRIALSEIRNLIDTIKFLKQECQDDLRELLDSIEKILTEIHPDDSTSLMNSLRLVRQTLETNQLSRQVWAWSLPYRSILRDLSTTQRDSVTTIQMKHPDILLLIGNYLFLLILVALGPIPDVSFTQALASLWDYVRPWQLTGLGMKPIYPKSHITGKSILDRHRLLDRLRKRVVEKNRSLDLQTSLTKIRFGQMIVLPSSGAAESTYLWLLFQRSPGIVDMNAVLLHPRGMDPSLAPVKILQEMVSGRTFWSESDLSLLSWHARLHGDEIRIRILVAEQHGEQILWVDDKENRRWIPVGRLHYTTRKFEDVTLVRAFELSEVRHLQAVEYDEIRRPHHRLEDMVMRAMVILNKGLEGCISTTCKVLLDADEETYRVIFADKTTRSPIGELLINRTADLLEILRRPDIECEPVLVNGRRLIWNRFNSIFYVEDVAVLRPWVIRYDPFPGMSLKFPPTAHDLLNTFKEHDISIELFHDPWTCPLKHISLEDIKKQHSLAKAIPHHYLFRSGSSYGEPTHVSNEPSLKHGSCWRISMDTPFKLSPVLQEIVATRFTDAHVRSLLESQELVYWSDERQKWVTHTFELGIRKDCIEEIKESWHLRTMIVKAMKQRYDSNLPGVYLRNPDRWSPYIIIEQECVTIGLRERDTGVTREKRVSKRDVALMYKYEVQKLLEREMNRFLEEVGIVADRRLVAKIRGAISDSIEMSGVEEDKASVEFDCVTIEQDSTGGSILYVVLISERDAYKIPVTGHLHDIRRIGRINKEEFERTVKGILDDFNLSNEDKQAAVKECVRVMRKEKLITR